MKILIADKLSERAIVDLKALNAEVDFQPDLTSEALPQAIADAQILVVRSTKVSKETVEQGNNLSLIIRAGAGVNTIDVQAASQRGVFVTNCPGKNTHAVSELTIGLLIACDRGVVNASADLRDGKWLKKKYGKGQGLKGRTLAILGMGMIGQAVAKTAQALEMNVVGWSRSLTPTFAEELGIEFAETPMDAVAKADAVSVHVAARPETKHLVDAALLKAMQEGAIFINTSRGEVVDTAALKEAIQNKKLRVGLDVFEDEPAGGEAEFGDTAFAELVTATPHIGASTAQAADAIAAEVVRIVKAFKETGHPPNTVNLRPPSQSTFALVVRHFNKVGVLASVLDALREEGVNIEEMENTIFEEGKAACCTLQLDKIPRAEVLKKLEKGDNIIKLTLEKT